MVRTETASISCGVRLRTRKLWIFYTSYLWTLRLDLLQTIQLFLHRKRKHFYLNAGFSVLVPSTRRQNVTRERWMLEKCKGARLEDGTICSNLFWRPSPRSVHLILLNTKYQESISSTYCYLQWKESCLGCPTGRSLPLCLPAVRRCDAWQLGAPLAVTNLLLNSKP